MKTCQLGQNDSTHLLHIFVPLISTLERFTRSVVHLFAAVSQWALAHPPSRTMKDFRATFRGDRFGQSCLRRKNSVAQKVAAIASNCCSEITELYSTSLCMWQHRGSIFILLLLLIVLYVVKWLESRQLWCLHVPVSPLLLEKVKLYMITLYDSVMMLIMIIIIITFVI